MYDSGGMELISLLLYARAKTLLSNYRALNMRRVPMLYSTTVSYYKEQNRQCYHDQLITEQTGSASTLYTDQLATLEFYASAVRVLGAAGGGLETMYS